MSANDQLILLAFLAGSSLVLLLFLMLSGRARPLDRLRDAPRMDENTPDPGTFAQLTRSALPAIGKPLLPTDEKQKAAIRTRLLHAGFYSPQAVSLFLGVKMVLMALPIFGGLAAIMTQRLTLQYGLLAAFGGAAIGMILPGMWLDSRKKNRQKMLRKALPDAFDMIALCMEGGMSMPAAFRLVIAELRSVHAELIAEFDIVQREIQLGRSTGEALDHFAHRCDMEEVRSLASAVLQSERLGVSLVRALRIHSTTLRQKRVQRAEEMAQKAAVKILFPTLLCIFPAIFLVVVGPSVIHITQMFAGMKK